MSLDSKPQTSGRASKKMGAGTSDYVLFSLLIPSWTIYIIFMLTLYKYRKKDPFKSPFFRLLFVLGIIDLCRNVEDWLVFKFAYFGWLGVNNLVMLAPGFLAKCHSLWAWYLGHAQIFGIIWLAFNRLSVVGFFHDWTTRQERIWIGTLLFLPVLTNIPLWPLEFSFKQNGSDGPALLFWENTHWQHLYLASCGAMCSIAAVICFLIYAALVYRARKHNKELESLHKDPNNKKKDKMDIRLMVVGIGLGVLCAFCGFACSAMAYGISEETLRASLPYFNLVNDMLCWVNPYMVLACSRPTRRHFKAVLLRREVNAVASMNLTYKNGAAKIRASANRKTG